MKTKQLILPADLNWLMPIVVDDLVRVGNQNDGGYVIPDSLIDRTEVLISFGLNDDWTFEKDFIKRNPIVDIHAYDYTVSLKIFRKRCRKALLKLLTGKLGKLSGYKKDRQVLKDYQEFFSGKNKHYENRIYNKNDAPFDITIDQVLAKTESNNAFVKMDIEGSEYRVISSLAKYHEKILGYAIEFHDTDVFRGLFAENVSWLQANYSIVHVHANNYGGVAKDNLPDSLEITFVRNDLLKTNIKRASLFLPKL